MELTDTTAREFHDWLRGKLDGRDYLFNELSDTHSMIYGTGSAQLYVLAMLAMVHAAMASDQYGLICSLPREGLEQVIKIFKDGGYHKSKTIFEQVSNFWLKDSQAYSMAFTKSKTGATLEKPLESKTGNKLKKDLASGVGKVSRIEGLPVKGRFYREFGQSGFSLGDVIDDRDNYFEARGSKARAMTTHGRDMKMSDLIYDAMIRRSCKFLLYDAIRQGRRVVYLLDDLDLDKVAYLSGKSGIPDDARIVGGPSDGKVPICTTEIREIFRNWDYFRAYLKFFKDFREAAPPWAAVHGKEREWAAYANHRARALLSSTHPLSTTQRGHLQACCDQHATSPAQAIESFHLARPSLYSKGAAVHTVTTEPEALVV